MIRLCITAEGKTERLFVNNFLSKHLVDRNIITEAREVLTSKDNRSNYEFRGGLKNYAKAKNDIQKWMKQDKNKNCWFSTMFDLYALPVDFPGYKEIKNMDPYDRVAFLEKEFKKDINDSRFIPYIQLHEFETLILSDPEKLKDEYLDNQEEIQNLIELVQQKKYSNPELINDGRETAPSKRILKEIPEYNKASAGVATVSVIGMQTLRKKCRHFNEWVSRLESLSV